MQWHSDEEATVLAERSGLGPRRSTATTTASSDTEEEEEEEEGPPRSAPAEATCCRRAALPPPLTGLPASGGPRLAEGLGERTESREHGPVLQGLTDGGAEALACGLRCSYQAQRPAAQQQVSEAEALRAPLLVEPLRCTGRWEYALSAQGMGAFRITAGARGELLFGKESWSGRPVAGALEPRDRWLQARLRFADDGEEQGEVRLRLERAQGAMLLNFRRHGQAEWGPDALASKVAALCPEGHTLQACTRLEAGCCSGCRRRVRKGGAAVACEACGFALCHSCWQHEVPAGPAGLFAAAWGALGEAAPAAPGELRGARVEVELAEGACLVRRRALCAEALLREVRGCVVTGFAEYRQQPLPLLHHLPLELPPPRRCFALLELDRGAWHLCLEAAGAGLALALGRGRAAGRHLEAFDASGGARPQSAARPVLQHARCALGPRAGLPRARAAALAAWLEGPLAALWQPQHCAGAAPDMPRLLAGLLALLRGAPPTPAPLGERGRALAALQRDGTLLRHCAPALQADRELVAVAVAQSGLALRYAAPALRADHDLALEAVRRDSRALHYTAPALLHDHDFLLAAACSRHTRATLVLSLAPREVRADRNFMCTAIRREPGLLQLAGQEAAQAAILAAWRASLPRRSLRRSLR